MTSTSDSRCIIPSRSNPSISYSALIQTLLNPTIDSPGPVPTPDETAAKITATIHASAEPATDLGELWVELFTAVITSTSSSYAPHIALLKALLAQPPMRPMNASKGKYSAQNSLLPFLQSDGQLHWSTLPRFGMEWRDEFDALRNRRAQGQEDSPTSVQMDSPTNGVATRDKNGTRYYLRFCSFSAALVKITHKKGQVYPLWVFFECSPVLECKDSRPSAPGDNNLTEEQLWDVDVRAAAIWLRDGGLALWELCETEHEYLREHYARQLDWETELWPGGQGLTRERWCLWEERLRTLSGDEGLSEETRTVATEAADVVNSLLGGGRN